ncbi:hypothetical protein K501DRAFT_282097 [Backusella circina FSU 941]|nr:hypothetical protein K501DRAFT_282097 [Backusella circina FSU 941]
MSETYYGYIETTQDVLLVFEACRRGILPKVCRRLQDKERKLIRSGSVFVFDERESGIKRWTDGLIWSPSRILGNFLIYRELDKKMSGDKRASFSNTMEDMRQRSQSVDQSLAASMSTDRNRERRLVGSLSDSYRFRKDGLIKKTMSIVINGVAQHLISYYQPNDILSNKLRTPSSVPELASLEISPELLVKQNFRIPPMVEPPFDQTEAGLTGSSLSSLDVMSGSYPNDRRIQSFRSMSLGSLRTPHPYQQPTMLDRRESNGAQMMYGSSPNQQRLDVDNANMNKGIPNNNLSTSYGNQGFQLFNNNTSNFAQLSPTMTSTSNRSSIRNSFSQAQQMRDYSLSTTGSPSGQHRPFENSGRNSLDMMTMQSDRSQFNSVHPHMMQDVEYSDDRIKTENDSYPYPSPKTQQSFSSSPNIGQLLNPIHPLNKSRGSPQGASNMLFQPVNMVNSSYPSYSSSVNNRGSFDEKLPDISNTSPNSSVNSNENRDNYGGGYNPYESYYDQKQQQQPLNNTHSVVPMIRNGAPNASYDNTQGATGSDLGMEPLMLK